MDSHPRKVLEKGGRRALSRSGLLLAAGFFLVSVSRYFLNLQTGMKNIGVLSGPTSQTLLSNAVSFSVGVGLSIISAVISIAALRLFVTEERITVPDEVFKKDVGYAVVNILLGWLVVGVGVSIAVGVVIIPFALIGAGLQMFVSTPAVLVLSAVPGVLAVIGVIAYLAIGLFFWPVYVAVEGETFYEAFRSSWGLAGGYKREILALLVVILLVNISMIGVGVATSFVFPRIAGILVMQALSAIGGVFALAVQARAYTQLA